VRFALGAVLALAFAGCASAPPLPAASDADAACQRDFAAFDAAVDRAGVRDAEADRIDGFPALRVNRLAAALAVRARESDAAFAVWVESLRRLDVDARRIEAGHLPAEDSVARLDAPTLDRCSRQLAASLRADAQSRAALFDRAHVPDRYRTAARAAGLYPLTRLPFFAGVQAWQREHEEAMREAARAPQPARRFAPAPQAPPALPSARDALGLPLINDAMAERLLAFHAPLFDIEQRAPFDDFGALRWNDAGRIDVDRARPTVYQRLTFTLVRGQALTQLVYTLWFPERPRTSALDLLGGALDGVIVRLTLAPDGTPILLDTIHACGCYHLFFPGAGVTPRPDAPAFEEWAFAPARLPALQRGERVVVRIASATHYVLGVGRADRLDGTPYARAPESALRALPKPQGGSRSLYGPDGLVAGSERAERFFFWPMGIASAGAMRQWGHHATAFVGRRHFDDTDLIDQRFTLEFAAAR